METLFVLILFPENCAVVCNLGSPIRQKENYNPKGVIVVMPVIAEMP